MRKLNKVLMSAGILLLSSMALPGCSDDSGMPKDTMGATFIQAITAGTDYVDLQWTITPTDKVDGYKIEIYSGTIGNLGSVVTSQTFTKKVYKSTFTGLQPNTTYVVASQCIPAAGSGFSKADVAYFEFTTAPTLTTTSVDIKVTSAKDEEGATIYNATVTVNWIENLTIQQVNNIYVYMAYLNYDKLDDDGNPEEVQVAYFTTPAINANTTTGTSHTFTVADVVPGGEYYIELLPNPSNYSWFTTGSIEWTHDDIIMPQAQ